MLDPVRRLRRSVLLTWLVVLAASTLAGGCKPAIHEAASEVPQAAAEGSVEAAEDQRLRQRIANVMGTPEIQHAMQELAAGLSKGVMAGLTDDQAQQQMRVMVAQLTRAIVTTLATSMRDLEPALKELADRTAALVIESTAQEIPRSLAPALHRAIVGDLGPAMRESLENDLAPGLAVTLRHPELADAIGATGHEIGRQAVLGSNAALAELEQQKRANEPAGPLGGFVAFFASRTWLVLLVVVAAAVILASLWLSRQRRAAERYRAHAERRAAEANALIRAIEAAQGSPQSAELLRLLRDVFPETRTEDERPPPSGPPPSRLRPA